MEQAPLIRRINTTLFITIVITCFRFVVVAGKPEINLLGAGASFPNEVYQAWMTYYTTTRLNYVTLHMSYDAVGSGAGKRRITGAEGPRVDYGGSDSLLDEKVKEEFPDIRMFPTMAGAVVIGYNIPELQSRLALSIPILTSIYNGSITHWDDPRIVALNPEATIPNERIKVLARADKSGTTSIFTSALCNEKGWKEKFGVFSQGESGSKWPNNTITYFAHQNRGMSGLILSFRYSIGYISIADAKESGVASALLHTKSDTVIEANTSTVQVAMREAAKYLSTTHELTTSLAQFSTRQSYPIAGLTYMIVFMTSMTNCDVALELVRYIYWFLTSKAAYRICVENNMTPLSTELVNLIRERIVERMTCNGENLWAKAWKQMEVEKRKNNTLLFMLVGLSIGIVAIGCTAIGGYLLSKRIKFMKKLSKREWEVNIEDIVFYQAVRSGDDEEERFVLWPSLTSLTEVDKIEDGFIILEHVLHWPGKWQGITIGLRLLEIKNIRVSAQSTQATLLWLKDINHTNILKFYGITALDKNYFMVSDYCSKGSLSQMLKDKKLNLNNDFKFALSLDVASGLAFLHSKGIVHGHLKSTNCLLDLRWTVKISDWEYFKLYQQIDKKKCFLLLIHQSAAELGENEAAMQELWTAPEILKSDFVQNPTFDSDVYSLAIILFEIFSRDTPYSEHFAELPCTEVLNAIVNNNLRPREDDMTPNSVRMIMDLAWSEDVSKRPNIDQMVKLLRGSHNMKKSVVDAMLEVTEEYSRVLQNQVKSATKKLQQTQQTLRTLIRHHVPSPFLNYVNEKLLSPNKNYSRESVHYTVTKSMSLLCVQCTTHLDPKTQWTVYNNLDLLLDNLLHSYGAIRVDIALGTFIVMFHDPEPVLPNATSNARKPSVKRDASSSLTATETVSLSGLSSYSDILSTSSAYVTSSAKSRADESPCEPPAHVMLPHVEAAADFCMELMRCAKDVFLGADDAVVGGLYAAIHCGPIDMCLLDNAIPRCLYYGTALDIVRNMVNHSAVGKVLVSDVFRESLIEEDLPYDFEPNVKINGKTAATFWLSDRRVESAEVKQLSYLPIIV